MNYFIKIDPKSIKKNPNAGNRDYFIDNGSTCTIEINDLHENIENDNIRMISRNSIISEKSIEHSTKYIMYVNNPEKAEELINALAEKHKENFSYTIKYNTEHVTTMHGEPEYFYEYEKTEIECSHCFAKFYHIEVKNESDYDYDGYSIGRNNICPKCNEEDCCELTFQKIKDAILEQQGIPKVIVGSN